MTSEKHSQNLFLTISKSWKKSVKRRKYLKTVILTYIVMINTNKERSTRVPEKHLFLLYWLCQSLWLCGSQQTLDNSERDGIPDHLICLLRNLYAGQEATVRAGHGTTDWFQIGKGVVKAVYCHPAYLTYTKITSWEMLGWRKHGLESRLLGEISITSDKEMTPPLLQKVKKN